MIEFTISRVVLCVCGVALLALAMSAVGTTEDRIGSDLDEEAAQEIADILDRFEESVLTSLTLEAADVLPSAEHTLTVRDNVVMLECGDRCAVAYTECDLEIYLDWSTGRVTVVRSVPEGLGDVPDGVGEDVDLL